MHLDAFIFGLIYDCTNVGAQSIFSFKKILTSLACMHNQQECFHIVWFMIFEELIKFNHIGHNWCPVFMNIVVCFVILPYLFEILTDNACRCFYFWVNL